jgi:HSP20 family protein
MMVKIRNYPRTSPWFSDLVDIDRHLENAFGDIFESFPADRYGRYPLFDLAEYANETVLVAEIPGIDKKDLKISVDNGYLTVSGERKPFELPEGSNYIRNEIRSGKFSRTIELPHEVEGDKVSAELANGVLRVVLPKAEKVRPREISIK